MRRIPKVYPDFKLSMNADLLSNGLPHKGDAELNWPEGSTLGEMLALEGALASAQILGPAQMQVQGTLDTQAIELSAQLEGLGLSVARSFGKGSLGLAPVTDRIPYA